jgi:hypothetical chaperone protein
MANGKQVHILELDSTNDSPTSLPSLLYIASDGERIVGRRAAHAFIDRNVGREVLFEKVDLGIDIEGYVAGEGDNEAGGATHKHTPSEVREAVRAHAMVEVNSPGRLFQSLKTSLRHQAFDGTKVFGTHYQIEELTAMILREMKQAVDEQAQYDVRRAVLGRPVRFSTRDAENDVAEKRLRAAAELAGFDEVTFFYEPVAACVEYAIQTDRRQLLMVVDIGGGTCDVCVMEFGGAQETAERLAESRILGIAGVPVAGDAIDREITRARLFPHFGSRSRYGPSVLPMPQYIFSTLNDWQNLYKLNNEETINWLIATEMSSTQPAAIRALRRLIQDNYGYPVVREVEQAKKRLSDILETSIEIHHKEIQISEHLEREEFAHIIEYNLEQMMNSIIEAEEASQIQPGDVDCVLTTGGTSLVPAVRHMLEARYGPERLLQRDTFTSVATGLAIVAQYV